jgi:putative Holliday junction resolvase
VSHNNQEFLGVDVGSARVGIARGASLARLAEPLKTVPASGAVEELADLADQNQTAAIIVGLPRSLDGKDTDQTKAVREWVKTACQQIQLPFYWQDEALTSVSAAAGKADDIDAQAAAVILQDFLDTPEDERVRC